MKSSCKNVCSGLSTQGFRLPAQPRVLQRRKALREGSRLLHRPRKEGFDYKVSYNESKRSSGSSSLCPRWCDKLLVKAPQSAWRCHRQVPAVGLLKPLQALNCSQ